MEKQKRIWEIDAARGIAVAMMFISNFALDLVFFAGYHIDITSGFWLYFARTTAFLFVFVAGISLALSFARQERKAFGKYLIRGLRIFGYGLLITFVTLVLFPQSPIFFGILHLIGLSIILGYMFLRSEKIALISGFLIVAAGLYLDGVSLDAPWLLWTGLSYEGFTSFDYTPVFPWFGFFLIGIFFGKTVYAGGASRLRHARESFRPLNIITWMGRNSLFLYLVHQPVFVGFIMLFLWGAGY